MNNLDFLWNACHVQHLSLFSDINSCDYACPCIASLKEETQWLKNEFKEICYRSKIVLDDSKIDLILIRTKTKEPVQMKHMAINVHVWLITME